MSELTATTATPEVSTFDYVNLQEVDPNFKAVVDGFYTLRVMKAFLKEFTYGPTTKKAGQTGKIAKFQFAIVDDGSPERGKRVFEGFFPDARGLANMRRLMDATGVPQEDGESIAQWLEKLVVQGAIFKVRVGQKQAVDFVTRKPKVDPLTGKPEMANEVLWKEAQPA